MTSRKSVAPSSAKGITTAELRAHNGRHDQWWTAIYGDVYDISDFYASHPGGDIIRTAAGRDATTLFQCYHPGMKMSRVENALATKCKKLGPLTDGRAPGDDRFYREVQSRVEAYFAKRGVSRHFYEVIGIGETVLTILLYLVATYYTSVYGSLLASAALGLLTARLGFIMHSGNHMGTSKYGWANTLAGYCMELAGSSHIIWYHEHQVAHHMDPNEVGKDNDCSIGKPHLRFHPDVPFYFTQKWQHVTTFIAMSGGFIKWYLVDFFNFKTGKVGSVDFHVNRGDWIRLLAFKLWWLFSHVIVGAYYQGFWKALGLSVLMMVIGAQYLENIFIVNHIQEDLAHPPPGAHWANKQVLATSNWASGSVFWNWVSGGLNHQVEHHLFPSVSIYLYPAISDIVRTTCKEFNLPYHNYSSFPQAWLAMARYLRDLGNKGEYVAVANLTADMAKGRGLDEPSAYLNGSKDVKDQVSSLI